jgi:hypothetical protein
MKTKFLVTLCLVAWIIGCDIGDDNPVYSEKQQKALAVFNGTFADYQYSNLGDYELSHLQPDPDQIVFKTQYSEPMELRADDYMNGSKYMGEAHGECTYKKMPHKGAAYENIECYFKVAYDASALTLYRKSNKEMYHTYTLFIDSNTEFRLYQTGLSLPYIFKKQ